MNQSRNLSDSAPQNATDDNYIRYNGFSVAVQGFATLPVVIFGLAANLVCLRVFVHWLMLRQPINWYLAMRSVADFLLLLTTFFHSILPRLAENYAVFDGVRVSYWLTPPAYSIGMVAQTLSVYMVVMSTAHRFIAVCFPFRAAEILTRRRVKLSVIAGVLFSVIFNITRAFEARLEEKYFVDLNLSIVQLRMSSLRQSQVYQELYCTWLYLIFMFVIPFLALIIMNFKVIFDVHETRKRHVALSNSDERRSELAKEISTSIMLIGVVVLFIACNTLAFVVNILEIVNFPDSKAKELAYMRMVDVSNFLVALNSSITIVIYFVFSEKFRIVCINCLCCGLKKDMEPLMSVH